MAASEHWHEAFDDLGRQVRDWYSTFARHARERGFVSLVEPVAPYNQSRILAPAVAAAAVVGIVMLGGVVVAASVIAAAALAAVIFLLTEIFGYDLALAVAPGPAR